MGSGRGSTSSGGWVKVKLKLPHFHVYQTCPPAVMVADEYSPPEAQTDPSKKKQGRRLLQAGEGVNALAFPPWDKVRPNARNERGLVHRKSEGKKKQKSMFLKAVLKTLQKIYRNLEKHSRRQSSRRAGCSSRAVSWAKVIPV